MRLTEKDVAYITSGANVIEIPDIIEGHKYTGQVVIKLGQLEDIEDELGIDLITLFKALNGCWFLQISTKKIFGDIRPTLIYQGGWHLKPNLTELPMLYALKDYGKTWALTKEKL